MSERHPNFTPTEHANWLAARAVASATAYLDGRHGVDQLEKQALEIQIELLAASACQARSILDPVRLLNIAAMRTARTHGDARRDRWRQVLASLVDLVRHESNDLRRTGAQRS